jgi:hypothetical protein
MGHTPPDAVIFDLNTTCALCLFPIQPEQVVLVGKNVVRCPNCGRDFSPIGTGPAPG